MSEEYIKFIENIEKFYSEIDWFIETLYSQDNLLKNKTKNDMVSFIRNIKEFCFVELEKNNNNTEIFLKSINKNCSKILSLINKNYDFNKNHQPLRKEIKTLIIKIIEEERKLYQTYFS